MIICTINRTKFAIISQKIAETLLYSSSGLRKLPHNAFATHFNSISDLSYP